MVGLSTVPGFAGAIVTAGDVLLITGAAFVTGGDACFNTGAAFFTTGAALGPGPGTFITGFCCKAGIRLIKETVEPVSDLL